MRSSILVIYLLIVSVIFAADLRVTFEDKYRVIKWIASGYVSKVFLASRKQDGLTVAIKRSKKARCRENERTILTALNSDHFVKFMEQLDSLEHEMPINIYEYIDSGTLSDLDEVESISEEELLAITLQLLLALSVLEQHKIVHRDIHRGNVMVHSDGTVKLIDFDWAVKEDQAEVFKERGDHMAPEIYRSELVSCKADVWSVGYCVARFKGNPLHGILMEQRGFASVNMEAVSASELFKEFLVEAMRTSVDLRWSAVQLLAHDILIPIRGRERDLVKQLIMRKPLS